MRSRAQAESGREELAVCWYAKRTTTSECCCSSSVQVYHSGRRHKERLCLNMNTKMTLYCRPEW